MPSDSRIRAIVLTVRYGTRASYYEDWREAFERSPLFAATTFNLFRRGERRAAMRALEGADLVVALHAASADTLAFLEPLEAALQARRGRLLMLVGNEYNLPWMPLGDKLAFIKRVGADFVGTQLPLEAGKWLYAGTGAEILALPHALNDAVFRHELGESERPLDIGGRSARYPVFIGDDERNRVYDLFREWGPRQGLSVDIDNSARLDRPAWARFLNDCRGTIGSEAGSWYLERDDRTVLEIQSFIRGKAGGAVLRADGFAHRAARRLPYPVKAWLRRLVAASPIRHEAIDDARVPFGEIEERFFAGRLRCPAYSKCISSRHFDAAGTGTCQILINGRYNDILAADEHYIALAPDFANLGEAIARFRDAGERARIAEAARALALEAHTYRHRIAGLYDRLSGSAEAPRPDPLPASGERKGPALAGG
ncbi:MAG TPA: glycosyltransferase [Stellaceae bacterium]|nr:glycosyltransferase [Stellaceae bacterium]